MDKIKNFFKKYFKTDSLLHLLICFVITFIIGLFIYPYIAFAITLFIGFMKEIIWDNYLDKGEFEWKDIIFDIIGALLAMVLLFTVF